MKLRTHRKSRTRDLHVLTPDGMVACNPRDREAAHRAQVEGIATENLKAVTCRKCRAAASSSARSLSGRKRTP